MDISILRCNAHAIQTLSNLLPVEIGLGLLESRVTRQQSA
jgi:hypothetical protein